jgi:DNA-binding transcriptional regulator LsrR (DeoR family)
MRIVVIRKGVPDVELRGQAEVAKYLGWTVRKVADVLHSGDEEDGISLDIALDREREGDPVVAYTATTVTRFKSRAECARVYGISRNRLDRLIKTGATMDDGITTFDEPCC